MSKKYLTFDRQESALNLWEDIKDEQIKKVQIVPQLPLGDLESSQSPKDNKSPRSERRSTATSTLSLKEQEANCQKLFQQFDLNEDQKVDYEELFMYMKKLNRNNKEVSEDDIKAMMLIADNTIKTGI
jgi:hypothetical protein